MTCSVSVRIDVEERNGETVPFEAPNNHVTIRSHWNHNGINGLVVLDFGDHSVTVPAAQLRGAIERCTQIPK